MSFHGWLPPDSYIEIVRPPSNEESAWAKAIGKPIPALKSKVLLKRALRFSCDIL
jgi:hypothetical protein